MDTGQIIALGFLVVVGLGLLSTMLTRKGIRDGLLWVLIFFGLIAVTSQWDAIKGEFTQGDPTFSTDTIEIPKGPDNHFRLTLQINNVPVEFLVDTGATNVVLTQEDAQRIGFDPDSLSYIGTAFTANGEVATAPVRLDRVDLGDLRHQNVPATVNGGAMESSLLGMSYLSRFRSIEITPNLLIINL